MKMMQRLLLVAMLVIVATAVVCSTGVISADGANDVNDNVVMMSSLNGQIVLAELDPDGEAGQQFNDMKKNITTIVNSYIIPALMTLVSIVALIMGILNCVKYFKSTEEEARTKAKRNLIGWFIGLVLAFALIWIMPPFITFLGELMPAGGV